MKTIANELAQHVIPEMLPVIPTMDIVVFPHIIVPLLVLDERIIKGINQSLEQNKLVMLLAAKESIENNTIGTDDLYRVGTVGSIMRVIKIPEGGVKILVQGLHRASIQEVVTQDNVLLASIQINDLPLVDLEEITPVVQRIKNLADQMSSSGHTFSPDFHIILSKMQDSSKIADFILSHLNLKVGQAQALLESGSQKDFLESLYLCLSKEVELAEIQEKIRNDARNSINQSQKEFYLREQLKAIKQELGEDDVEEIEAFREKLALFPLSDEVKTEINRQINRLERTAPDSLEATVTRNYLEWVFALPWGKETEDNLDIKHAKEVLDEEHYGLKDIKERILDFISVRNLKRMDLGLFYV